MRSAQFDWHTVNPICDVPTAALLDFLYDKFEIEIEGGIFH